MLFRSFGQCLNNLINHVFIFENFPVADALNSSSGMKASFQEGFAQTNYDFNVVVVPEKNICIKFNFNANVYAEQFVNNLKDHFAYLLMQVLQDPQTRIEKFELMPLQVQEGVLLENSPVFNLDFSRETFTELFERNVAIIPNAIALITENEEIDRKSVV